MLEKTAIVVVADAELASSLELALLAGGLCAILAAPDQPLEDLPLERATKLVIDQRMAGAHPVAFIAALRARPWLGLVILITGDREELPPGLEKFERVTVLEMPFQGADLIAAIRAG